MFKKLWLPMLVALLLLKLLLLTGCRSKSNNHLATVSTVDLNRYLGLWYEIARYPNGFEKNCVGVTATYSLRKDGAITVYNHAHLHTLDGKEQSATGKAIVADPVSKAKLRVSFFGPFYGDYWIIALGEQYEYAVVSEPSRKYLWILSRTPQMDDARYQQILVFLTEQGFDIARLTLTPQK